MTKKYTYQEWKDILEKIKNGLSITKASNMFHISRNQIHLKIRQTKEKSLWIKLKELFR